SVDHIFLAGGVAATDGLVSLVENHLATPTTIANPFTNMSMSPRVNALALGGDAPAMIVAAGLALRAMD
ncbi:MAG: pilus assembly protein PilM, partial [Pseudomonadota bacterium]|nr:pilus assembly protein PilM [Pseudomonadota bacterium]